MDRDPLIVAWLADDGDSSDNVVVVGGDGGDGDANEGPEKLLGRMQRHGEQWEEEVGWKWD